MIRILHTADWHIGKVLHKHPLHEEMDYFFSWLLDTIVEKQVDILLVSGDIFDLANPGAREREMYYRFLSQLIATNIKVVITGGNHDGVGVINAPKEVLHALNISVIGGAKDDLYDELIEIKNSEGTTELIIAAVPFLRDKDLRNLEETKKHKSRIDAIRGGIKTHYQRLGEICSEKYKGVPAITMGHLYAKGSTTSESERDIHMGNAVAVESSIFPSEFGYVALGHIHRPQVIGKNEWIRYSGSPIPLSFSERDDEKGVLILDLENGQFGSPEFLSVPKQRELRKFSGNFESISANLKEYKPDFPLPSFVELEFIEDAFSSVVLSNIDELVSQYSDNPTFQILKNRTEFKTGAKDTADLFTAGENIEDLTPQEVFAKRIDDEDLDSEKKAMINNAFREILEMVQSEEL